MNKNDLIQYDTNMQPIPSVFNEGFSYYETVSKLIEIINELNISKLDKTGNLEGSWHGIEKPVLIEGGIDATVVKNSDDIETIKETIVNLVSKTDIQNLQTIIDLLPSKFKKNSMPRVKSSFHHTGYKCMQSPSKAGEPFVVYDYEISKYHMFFFDTNNSIVCKRAESVNGIDWTLVDTNISNNNLINRHKFTLLVDVNGNPVKLNGKYHGYVVDMPPQKKIYHWESDSISGKWIETGVVLSPNTANNGTDTYGVDAPCVVYDNENSKIIIYYMSYPNNSLPNTLFGSIINRAVSDSPSNGFIYNGEVLRPNLNINWIKGWLGGIQILKIGSELKVILNGGSNQATSVGQEPDPSSIGFGVMKDLYSPIIVNDMPTLQINTQLTGLTNYNDTSSIWRGCLVYNKKLNKYLMYYNTGGVNGQEWITLALEGGTQYDIPQQLVNSTRTIIDKTDIYLPNGFYNIKLNSRYFVNGTSPTITPTKIEIKMWLSKNPTGTPYDAVNDTLVYTRYFYGGNYAYQNDNINIEKNVLLADSVYKRLYFTVQIIEGTGVTNETKILDTSLLISEL